MSHKNYNKMYNKPEIRPVVGEQAEVIEEVLEPAVEVVPEVPEVIEEPVVEAEPEVIEEPADRIVVSVATLVGCERLNVRKEPSPNAEIVTVLNKTDEVACEPELIGNYYKVHTTSGIEGYCVKDYLKLK